MAVGVIVLDAEGQNLGIMPMPEARNLAYNNGLDLVQINNNKGTPVYKIMDRGKFEYQKQKQAKKQKPSILKEIKFRPKIDPHDLATKLNHVQKFLEKGFDVKLTVEMRGREKAHRDMAHDKLNNVLASLESIRSEGVKQTDNQVYVIVHPDHGKVKVHAQSNDNGERDEANQSQH